MMHADKTEDRIHVPPFKNQTCASPTEDLTVSMKLWCTLDTEELVILENTFILQIILLPEKK